MMSQAISTPMNDIVGDINLRGTEIATGGVDGGLDVVWREEGPANTARDASKKARAGTNPRPLADP
jgi:hypothetical protein